MASRPDGDVWNIVDNDKDSQHYGRNFKFDFSYISSEEIKDVVKDYVWQNYRVGNKSLSSLYNEVKACFFQFIRFADTRNITSLKGLTNTDVDHFISYLHTTISERTKKPFGTGGQRVILNTLKSIIRWCQLHRPMILSPESKIAGLRAKEIKGKLDDLFHGKTEDEIDDVISGLAKTMSFNPLPTGVCLYDFRRGNCTDGDGCFFYNCPNYITEVQFYPILKDELDLLEKEMARLKELGQEPAYQVQAVKYKYLKPLVESLEVQLNGKESVGQSGCRH